VYYPKTSLYYTTRSIMLQVGGGVKRRAGAASSSTREIHAAGSEADASSLTRQEEHAKQPLRSSIKCKLIRCFQRAVIVAACTVLALLLWMIGARQFVLPVFNIEFSQLLHPIAQRWGWCEWHSGDCRFDLCTVAHEGGEGVLFQGICDTTTPVLWKSYKVSNLRLAYMEAKATQALASYPNSPIQVLKHGPNYLMLAKLVEYQESSVGELFRTSQKSGGDQLLRDVLVQVMTAMQEQMTALHRGGYLHRDIKFSNMLQRKNTKSDPLPEYNNSGTPPILLLIDSSNALPIKGWQPIIKGYIRHNNRAHQPRHPGLICLLPRMKLRRKERVFCQGRQSRALCPGYIDSYPFGILVLQTWYRLTFGREEIKPKSNTFGREAIKPKSNNLQDTIQQHDIYRTMFNRLQENYDTRPVDMFEPLRLLKALILGEDDTDLVCRGT
jgi:hypothetical protein